MEPKRLNEVIIPFPCPMKWNDMQKNSDNVHFCTQCNKHVHDLTSASDKDFKQLHADTGGDFCAVYESKDIDFAGSIRAQDQQIRLSRFLYALLLVFGTSLFTFSYAGDVESLNHIRKQVIHSTIAADDSVGVFFRVSSDSDVIDNRQVIIYEEGKVYATRSLINGYFEIALPAENKAHTFTFFIAGYVWEDKKIRIKVKNGAAVKSTYDLRFKKVLIPRLTGRFL